MVSEPPGRVQSSASCSGDSPPAHSNTKSAPRPAVSAFTAAACAGASPSSGPSRWVAPIALASASRAGSRSMATITSACCSRAPCTAFRPTAPQPTTTAAEPGSTRAIRTAAPTPVITPQPIRQARSNGMAFGTAIAPDSGTTVYCACVEVTEKWLSIRSPSSR